MLATQVGRHGAVGIGGEDPFAPCVVNANGHGAFFCCHFWKFVIDRQKVEIVQARGGDDLGCVICRVVVNDEDFKSVGRIGLSFQGIEALTDIIRFIAGGNDDGYKWRFISCVADCSGGIIRKKNTVRRGRRGLWRAAIGGG